MFPALVVSAAVAALPPAEPLTIPLRSGEKLVVPPLPPKINFPSTEEITRLHIKSLDRFIASAEADLAQSRRDRSRPSTIQAIEGAIAAAKELRAKLAKPFNIDDEIKEREAALAALRADDKTPRHMLDAAQQSLDQLVAAKKQLAELEAETAKLKRMAEEKGKELRRLDRDK
jgi:hypothetical protein